MATVFMVRTPGAKDFPTLSHLLEGHVYDGVPKADAELLVEKGLAEEFDENEEAHAEALQTFSRLDFRNAPKPKVVAGAPTVATPKTAATAPTEAADYEGMTADEVHKLAAERNLEGRAGLNKADTVKLLQKDDAKKGKK